MYVGPKYILHYGIRGNSSQAEPMNLKSPKSYNTLNPNASSFPAQSPPPHHHGLCTLSALLLMASCDKTPKPEEEPKP